MARSARWFIAGGYAVLVGDFAIVSLLPFRREDWGIINAASALALGGLLLILGLVRGVQAVIRERRQTRWFDYLVLALGIAPFAFLFVARLALH